MEADGDWPDGEVLLPHAGRPDPDETGTGKLDAPFRGHQPGGPGGLKCAPFIRSACACAPYSSATGSKTNWMRNCDSIWISKRKRTSLPVWSQTRRAGLQYVR